LTLVALSAKMWGGGPLGCWAGCPKSHPNWARGHEIVNATPWDHFGLKCGAGTCAVWESAWNRARIEPGGMEWHKLRPGIALGEKVGRPDCPQRPKATKSDPNSLRRHEIANAAHPVHFGRKFGAAPEPMNWAFALSNPMWPAPSKPTQAPEMPILN